MALRKLWTDRAKGHLRDILDFIAFDNPAAARALARRIFTSVERLAEFPHAGRHLPELEDAPFRERVVPPCRIIYQIQGDTLIILVILRVERHLTLELLEH